MLWPCESVTVNQPPKKCRCAVLGLRSMIEGNVKSISQNVRAKSDILSGMESSLFPSGQYRDPSILATATRKAKKKMRKRE